ncbi:MAG: DTW domain-containing protein [Oligoflexia bacterium]|nr:DTW domain-containing protein [Oligoflexia bacterium]
MQPSSAPTSARRICPRCRRAGDTCYCAAARTIHAPVRFVVLLHPQEARRRIGTARIVKLCIPDTVLLVGKGPELDENAGLLSLLSDPGLQPLLLFPGPEATAVETAAQGCEPGKKPVILVVDGTWKQAGRMLRESRLLQALPRVSFAEGRSSAYGFRRQPAAHCLSTVEAVHEAITRLQPPGARDHDVLLEVFSELVRCQVAYSDRARPPRTHEPLAARSRPVVT